MPDRKTLPKSIMAQTYGLTPQQIQTVEIYGAMLDRAAEAGAATAEVWTDENGAIRVEVDFDPIIFAPGGATA